MESLRSELARRLTGRTCVVGVGNPDLGDDAVGVRVAEALAAAGVASVVVAGAEPERVMAGLTDAGWDNVLFVDAVGFGGEPGAAIVMDAAEIAGTFPQISTHKISLGTLAGIIEREGGAQVSLLGVQPQTLESGSGLSSSVRESGDALVAILRGVLGDGAPEGSPLQEDAAGPATGKHRQGIR